CARRTERQGGAAGQASIRPAVIHGVRRGTALRCGARPRKTALSIRLRPSLPLTEPNHQMRTRLSIALLALSPFATALAQTPSASAPRVQTVNGTVAGTTLPSGVKAFRGVPFADAPVRQNRWRPPQPVKNWAGVRLADRFADQCMQARVFGDMMFRNSGVSEDCLYLNVWAPANATA